MLKHSILVVDDEESIRITCARALAKSGYQVLSTESGEKAMEILKETPHDLVITDLLMDGMSGIELFGEVVKINPDTMFIIFTGHSSASSAIEAIRLGASDYLLKPYDKKELLFRVENCFEKLRLRRQLESKTRELERSNEALMDFASIASHDLHEPLRKVISFSNRIKNKWNDTFDDQTKDYFSRMQNATLRMEVFLDDLLELSKVTAKGRCFESVDLKQVLKDVVDDLETRISETKGAVNVNSLPTLEADPLQMRQLFQNLVSNALKYHKEGVPPVVDIRCRQQASGNWEIELRDNGIGLDEKCADRIFRPFERLHGRSAYEGSGMGLAICKKIVTRHGGTISVKSTVNHGATFMIILPQKQPETS